MQICYKFKYLQRVEVYVLLNVLCLHFVQITGGMRILQRYHNELESWWWSGLRAQIKFSKLRLLYEARHRRWYIIILVIFETYKYSILLQYNWTYQTCLLLITDCNFILIDLLGLVKIMPETSINMTELGIQRHKAPQRPEYATYEKRLQTFRKWPKDFKQTPEMLAEAGFYYGG